ncbi:MAG: hypothetical protein EPO08_09285 [Rhodospirillaceae bacterium]|nr:MAG: hypothetical protein EPO08_09285 [Rhodospirillaceae bacterium]
MPDTHIIPLLRGVSCRRALLPALAILGVLLAMGVPARADINDVMHEVQRVGSARVIITMKTDSGGRRAWTMAQSVDMQRATVAAAAPAFEQRLQAANIPLMRRYKTLPFAGAVVNADQLMSLAAMPEVASVHLVQMERKLPTPVVASGSVDRQQAVAYSGSLAASVASIDVPNAWAAGYQGQGYTVAVLDGGFNINHPMLSGKNVGDACFADTGSDGQGGALTAECPSGQTPQISSGAASNCPTSGTGAGRCDHGSNVASIAVGNDGTNFGVARGAKFMPIDVFSSDSGTGVCGNNTPCEITDEMATLDALDYINQNAATYNIAAVNMSLGGDTKTGYCDDDPRKVAIDNLRAKGIAVMIAAGNDGITGKVEEPACISTSEAIGSTDDSTHVSSFSNFATTVDLMGPGENIVGAAGSGSGLSAAFSGTSMATPHVAGAWAVVRSAFPTATADQIEQALKTTGIAVTRSGAGFTVPKIQVMHAINFVAGHNRLVFNQIISSNASTLGLSFLRVYNSTSTSGTITFTIRDAVSGTSLGTYTSSSVPAGASAQIALSDIEKNAVAAQGQTIAATGRSYYNLEAASTFGGYVQYILWTNNLGVLGNLTSCPAGLSTDGTTLLNIDAANNSGYVSHIRIVNPGAVAGTATLTFTNPGSGQQVAQWTSPAIPAGASYDITEPQIEAAVPALASATSSGTYQYNVLLTNFAGYLQHVVANNQVGLLTDLSAKCDLTASTSTSSSSGS